MVWGTYFGRYAKCGTRPVPPRRRCCWSLPLSCRGKLGDSVLPSNHRLERAVMSGWLCAASALRHFALASPWARLYPGAQPHR